MEKYIDIRGKTVEMAKRAKMELMAVLKQAVMQAHLPLEKKEAQLI